MFDVGPVGGYEDIASVEELLSTCQGELIEDEFGEAWPKCLLHGEHPIEPKEDGWHCPVTNQTWRYGTLAENPAPPDPIRDDGVVRWYLDDLGWGVIADHDGDVFVLFASIEMEGYRTLKPGQRVEYRIGSGRQGRFRRAEHVRLL